MEQVDCAYIAAFLDTDGWISAVPRNGGTTHGVVVGLVNRHLPVLEWVKSLFGGNLRARKINRKSPHAKRWSQTYDLTFGTEDCLKMLPLVLPHLKIKAEQCRLAIEMLNTTQDRKKEYRLQLEVKLRRYEIYQQIHKLNQVGISQELLEKDD